MPTGPGNLALDRRRAVVVASQASQTELRTALEGLGFEPTCFDDPYGAFAHALTHAVGLRAFVVSLQGLYREELSVLASVRDRLPHVDRIVAHTQARQTTLAEAVRCGAVTLLDDQGLHPLSPDAPAPTLASLPNFGSDPVPTEGDSTGSRDPEPADFDPLLSAEELRALLQDPS
jgi:hypothetical protein